MADSDETAKPTADERLAALEAENAAMKDTLRVLGGSGGGASGAGGAAERRSAAAVPVPGMIPTEAIERLRARTGWNDEQIRSHWPILEGFFAEIAAPILRGVSGMADTLDDLDTHTYVPEYKDEPFKEEVSRVRQEYIARGDFRSRKDVAALVKARRASDPKLIEKTVSERVEQEIARREQQASATTEGTVSAGTQSAGPSPTKGGAPKVTNIEDFKKLPTAEKEAVLAGATF